MLVCNKGARIWRRREKPEFVSKEEEREKNGPNWEINKIMICKATVTIYAGAELEFFVWGGPNFVTNILVSSQDKPSHSGINAHTQI